MQVIHRTPVRRFAAVAIAVATAAALLVVAPLPAPTHSVAAESGFIPVGPARLVDTRTNQGIAGTMGAGETASFSVGNVPKGSAVMLNVTATEPTQSSFVTVWPSGAPKPATSNLNFTAGQTVANLVIATVGDNGRVSVYNDNGSTQLLVDIFGWIPAESGFTPVGPARLVDTRTNQGIAGTMGAGETASFSVGNVPKGSAVMLNVTATEPTQSSFVTVWPSGAPKPATSNLNFTAGQTVANLVIATVGDNGRVSVYNDNGSTQLLVDIFGWIPAESGFTPVGPARLVDTRTNQGIAGTMGAGETASFSVGNVPKGSAVMLNVTATEPTQSSFVTVWPSGAPKPATSNLNFTAGQTVANLVIATVGDNGRVSVYNDNGSTQLLVDIFGWIPTGSGTWVPPKTAASTNPAPAPSAPAPVSGSTFLETFDGMPASPTPFSSARWDVRRNITDYQKWASGEPVAAQHGPDCGPPPATHRVANWLEGGVYQCKGHMMTAMNASSYGLTMLTPAAQVDFASSGTVSFDVSTLVMSGRDWIDLFVTPQDDFLALACSGKCPVVYSGTPRNAVNVEKDGPRWILKVIRDFRSIGSAEFFEVGTPSATARTTFELQLTPNGAKFGTPADGRFVSVDVAMPFTRGMVQWGHHSYNPTKDNSGVPATWHWDNFMIAPAVPVPMIKATTERVIAKPGEVRTVSFASPAPAGARLAFNAVCKVELDFGSGFVAATKQAGSNPAGPESSSSYLAPVPPGASSVRVRFGPDGWYDGFPCLFEDPVIFGR